MLFEFRFHFIHVIYSLCFVFNCFFRCQMNGNAIPQIWSKIFLYNTESIFRHVQKVISHIRMIHFIHTRHILNLMIVFICANIRACESIHPTMMNNGSDQGFGSVATNDSDSTIILLLQNTLISVIVEWVSIVAVILH